MKLYYIFIVCFLYILSTSSLFAEYYHYVDKNGVKHYTDDISEIPKDQRPDLTIHQSIKTPDIKEPLKTENKVETISSESLETKRDKLVTEYNALVKRNKTLAEQKNTIDQKKYNELATQLNIEIKQYQEKKQAYEKLVEQYNEQIKPSGKN